MLGRWDKRIVDQAFDVPSTIFFMISCKILCKDPFNLFSYFFYKITKIMIFAENYARFYEKKNTWNIRRLVDDSFVPSSKRPSVLYCKLTDFKRFGCQEVIINRPLSIRNGIFSNFGRYKREEICMKIENVTFQTMSYYLRMKNCYDKILTDDRSENYCFKRP